MKAWVDNPKVKLSSTQDMLIGQLARHIYCGGEHIILRMYEGFVSLSDPTCTWGEGSDFRVEIYPSRTRVILESEI